MIYTKRDSAYGLIRQDCFWWKISWEKRVSKREQMAYKYNPEWI